MTRSILRPDSYGNNPLTSSGTATDDAPAKEPEEAPAEKVTHVPDETEPVEEDAREEEAEAADTEAKATTTTTSDIPEGKIVAVEDAPSTETVSEDAAPLSDANPSGADLSKAANEAGGEDEEEGDTKP